jgi:hypothetical protein
MRSVATGAAPSGAILSPFHSENAMGGLPNACSKVRINRVSME